MNKLEPVNIRPEVSILSIFPHLNYKPWYAIAEFVDNSIQSYLDNKDILYSISKESKLNIEIDISTNDNGIIVIRDNAAGIHSKDYHRAFKTASLPNNRLGLSEFGVGMKSAACWFAKHWSVRTSAIGESIERTINFDVNTIVRNGIQDITPIEIDASVTSHFTEVTLRDLHSLPQGRTIGKIKEHLASIYRIFLAEGFLEIHFNKELISYTTPKILFAPPYNQDNEPDILWRKDIDLDFGNNQRVFGFAALREVANTSSAGFALFRRKRLIQGSGDEGYRPEYIFKRANSFTYQRLFGELHVEGFDVSHTKDGIQWAEYEDIFLEFLKEKLNEDPICLLDQAEGHRVRPKTKDLQKAAETALDSTSKVVERDIPLVVSQQLQAEPIDNIPPTELPSASTISERDIELLFDNTRWKVHIDLTSDPSVGDWLSISDNIFAENSAPDNSIRTLGIRLSLVHPFTERFLGPDLSHIEPLLRLAAAIALAETIAREGGVKKVGAVRMYINDLLRNALSKA